MKLDKLFGLVLIFLAFVVSPASAFAATFSLSPSSNVYNRGCTFSIDVMVDTAGNNTDGGDAILKFDPSRLTVNSITKGEIYPDYPVTSFGNASDANAGTIQISGVADVDTPFNGNGKFATINFTVNQAAPQAATQVNFDFDSGNIGNSRDSNIVQSVTTDDILTSVTNGSYTVGSGSCTGQGQTFTAPPATYTNPPTYYNPPSGQLPQAGISTPVAMVAGVGGILAFLGLIGALFL